jgi:NAD(P)-dependent dehydrogenase (short-subunit alcohol dehydrogenase family)
MTRTSNITNALKQGEQRLVRLNTLSFLMHFTILTVQHTVCNPINEHRPPAVVGSVTARVGSIGDNRLGGWYSYRMSKSAMNQFTKTFSLEATRDNCFPVSLHPGTVDTGAWVQTCPGVSCLVRLALWACLCLYRDLTAGADE